MWEQKINPMQETNDQIHPGGAITARHWDTLRMSVGRTTWKTTKLQQQ